MSDKVLVTGISGFIASHIAERLLNKGYFVRGTVRNLEKGERVRQSFADAGLDVSKLELLQADLGSDAGWKEAVKECRYIQHIASPLPHEAPTDREALVPEARAGAQRVLERGFSAGAEHIVMTSSIAAMIGQPGKNEVMTITEDDWSDPEWRLMTAYPISKTRAEQSAWAYVKAQGLENKLTTICPGIVFGPDTYGNGGASLGLLKALMIGKYKLAPKIAMPLIDIRDCAAIHVNAMTVPSTGGRRLLATGQTLWFQDIAAILREVYPELKGVPKGEIPSFIIRIMAMFDASLRPVLSELGTFHVGDAAYVTNFTGVVPRPAKEAILAGAQSLIENGSVRLS